MMKVSVPLPKSSHILKKPTENVDKDIRGISTSSLRSQFSSKDLSTKITVPESHNVVFLTPPFPSLPSLDFYSMPKEAVLLLIQQYISSFQYNYTSTMYFKLKKNGTTHHILEVFNLLTKYALPIQCVEAVFIGSILSAGWDGAVRIPICFKSKLSHTQYYRHIILAVYKDGKWGALGISRRSNLMYKDFAYYSLWQMLMEYRRCYEESCHRLLSIYCGLPMPNNFFQDQPIIWKAFKMRTSRGSDTNDQVYQEQLSLFLSQYVK
jgi:hypothetical protein